MTSQFKGYLGRTVDRWRSARVTSMDSGIDYTPFTMYSFNSSIQPLEPPSIMALGADSDIGGLSTSKATAVPTASFYEEPPAPILPAGSNTAYGDAGPYASETPGAGPSSLKRPSPLARFREPTQKRITGSHMSHVALHGNMSLRLPPAAMGKIKTGYVGMRNHHRSTALGGEDIWDVRQYTHIKMQVAYRGWEGWRKRWYCNIQTAGPIQTDIYQLRLDLPPSPASTSSRAPLDPYSGPPPRWTTLHLPLSSFVLTNHGTTSATQIGMMTEGLRSVGFSLLGGGRDTEGVPIGQPGQNLANLANMDRTVRGNDANIESHPQFISTEDIDGDFEHDVDEGSEPGTGRGARRRRRPKGSLRADLGIGSSDGAPGGMDGVTVTPWSEGYYELCVRYVQAVNYNAMMDERPSEWEEWE